MKKFLFLAIAFFSFQFVDAQEQTSQTQDKIYQMEEVDIKPEYPGGTQAFNQFIVKIFRTPSQQGLNGKIITTFVIEIDGSVSNINVVKDIGYWTGDEAVRVVKKSKKWIPAQKEGKPVRVLYQFPITISAYHK